MVSGLTRLSAACAVTLATVSIAAALAPASVCSWVMSSAIDEFSSTWAVT